MDIKEFILDNVSIRSKVQVNTTNNIYVGLFINHTFDKKKESSYLTLSTDNGTVLISVDKIEAVVCSDRA